MLTSGGSGHSTAGCFSNEILHLVLKAGDQASLCKWQLVSHDWSALATAQLYSRTVHIKTSSGLISLLEGIRKISQLRRIRHLTLRFQPAAEHFHQLHELIAALGKMDLPPLQRITLACPDITRVMPQRDLMQSNALLADLLNNLRPKQLEILRGSLPFISLSWRPEHVTISEALSYEHMLPIWLPKASSSNVNSHASTTAITLLMQGTFAPRDQPISLPHRIKGRYFRLMQFLERAADYRKITIVGMGAIVFSRLQNDPGVAFTGPIPSWGTTLPGSAEVDFDTEFENQQGLAACLRAAAVGSGLTSLQDWDQKIFFCPQMCSEQY